jgi:hypothetical protein
MANKKISALTALGTTPAGSDILPITDVSGTATTKKVTVTNLMAAAPVQSVNSGTGAISIDAGNLSDFNFDGNAILGFAATFNDQTGTSYTVQTSDAGKVVTLNNGSATTVTIPDNLGTGFCCSFLQKGAGQVTFSASGTGLLKNRQSHTKIAGQNAVVSILGITGPSYILAGDTAS